MWTTIPHIPKTTTMLKVISISVRKTDLVLKNFGTITFFESLQKDTEDVKKVMVPKKVRTGSVFCTEILITFSMVVVLGIWGVVVHMQHKGDFTSQKLVVQVSQD